MKEKEPDKAELIGLDHTNTWRRFRMLETDGVIKVEARGTKSMATRYRYLGGK